MSTRHRLPGLLRSARLGILAGLIAGTEEEAIARIWSSDLMRRDLTQSQRALIAEEWATLKQGRPKSGTSAALEAKTIEAAAARAGVGERYVRMARERRGSVEAGLLASRVLVCEKRRFSRLAVRDSGWFVCRCRFAPALPGAQL